MDRELTVEQAKQYEEFIQFTKENIEPYAHKWDINEELSDGIIEKCNEKGYLGALIPKEYGGLGYDCVTYGLMNEAFGYASVSLTGLFNVHSMIAQTLVKWGTEQQKERWLPKLAKGELIAALAITEPTAGSDMKGIETTYESNGDHFVLNGGKRWITFGGLADLYLVFGKLGDQPVACFVERETKGFNVTRIKNMLGFRAGYLAALEFNHCEIPKENMVGGEGIALSYLAPYALEYGRISVAWAALGVIRGCLEACSARVLERKTYNRLLIEHGAISKFVADMGVDYEAAKLLCLKSCQLKDAGSFEATESIMTAKYFTSKASAEHSSNAVQIFGALGCNEDSAVARYYRDSKTFGIIEGSNEIHQMLLGKSFARKTKKNMERKEALETLVR